MKRIGLIFFILLFGVQPLLGQLTAPQTGAVSPPTQKEASVDGARQDTEGTSASKREETSTDSGEQAVDSAPAIRLRNESNRIGENSTKAMETEKLPDTPVPPVARWEGKQRILKVVNDYHLAADEVLTTLVMIAGDATIHGTVTGNVLVLGGDVELAPSAQVKGVLRIIGGQHIGNIKAAPDFRVSTGWAIVPAVAKLLMHPHSVWGISKTGNFRLTLFKFVLFLLTYLLVVLIFPKPVNAMSTLFAQRPTGSVFFSILMFVVISILFAALTLSIVGVPCLLLGIALLLPLAIFGKASIFLLMGSTLLAGRLKPFAVIFGYILYFMATEVPYIDWVAFLVVNIIGIGLCLLACFRQRSDRGPYWAERVG